jgi:hypothetical protein
MMRAACRNGWKNPEFQTTVAAERRSSIACAPFVDAVPCRVTMRHRSGGDDRGRSVDETALWDALRERGVDADDPDIRAAVREALTTIDEVERRAGRYVARRCAEAMHEALQFELSHPDTRDMSRFEGEFDDDS